MPVQSVMQQANEVRENKVTTIKTDTGEIKLSSKVVKTYLVAGGGNVSDQEVKLFIALCSAQKLNPFIKEAHLIKYGNSPATMVVSKDVYQKRADKHPEYQGKKAGIIVLTAEGKIDYRVGTFYMPSREELVGVSVKEALNHPNWSMGAKITIDSATLFNKGLEVMEAKWLFDVDYDQIEVLIHPESILHSAVEFEDTSVIGQMGTPDMRLAIQYALTYPQRKKLVNGKSLDLTQLGSLTFKKPDFKRFHALALAYHAGKTGGSMPCVLNGANEMANLLFREGKIEFLEIEELVEKAMNAHKVVKDPTIDQLLEIDQWARNYVLKEISDTCRPL